MEDKKLVMVQFITAAFELGKEILGKEEQTEKEKKFLEQLDKIADWF
jgi:hypothetical protein